MTWLPLKNEKIVLERHTTIKINVYTLLEITTIGYKIGSLLFLLLLPIGQLAGSGCFET